MFLLEVLVSFRGSFLTLCMFNQLYLLWGYVYSRRDAHKADLSL